MQNVSLPVFGRGFETYHHRQMDIGRTHISLTAVSPWRYGSDNVVSRKSPLRSPRPQRTFSLFCVFGMFLKPLLVKRLSFLAFVETADFRNDVSCKGIQNLFRYIYIIFVFLFVHMCLSAIYAPLARLRAVYSLSWEKICPTAFVSLVGHKLSDFRPLSWR